MSTLIHLMEAWLIGIAIAAPVGPIGMLCIRKTLEIGLVGAIAVGLGAALADSAYGLVAALGLTAVSHFLLAKATYIKLVGGVFLLYLAYMELKVKPSSAGVTVGKSKNMSRLTAEVFFLTLTNPATILSFIGIFASIGGGANSTSEMFLLVLGIFLGSMTWWLFLGTLIVKIKHKLPESWIHRIRYLSAIILGGFGLWAVLSGFFVYVSLE
jgi:putative LysE/RhtB family amino acid efflux pump